MRTTSWCAGTVPGPPNARRHAASRRWSGAGSGAVAASTCTRRRTLTPPLWRLPGAPLRLLLTAAGPAPLPSTVTFINAYVHGPSNQQLAAGTGTGTDQDLPFQQVRSCGGVKYLNPRPSLLSDLGGAWRRGKHARTAARLGMSRSMRGEQSQHVRIKAASVGGVVKKPRAMDMMGAGRGALEVHDDAARRYHRWSVDFHGTVVPGLVFKDDERLKDGLVGRSRSARPCGRPRFRGETAQLKLPGGDWIDGQDTLSWCDVETV
jgi:hypothetical protein